MNCSNNLREFLKPALDSEEAAKNKLHGKV